MNKKIMLLSVIAGVVMFALELTFVLLTIKENIKVDSFAQVEWLYPSLFIASWALSAIVGGLLQYYGAKYHNAEGYIITAGFGLQIPLFQFITIYFVYREFKDHRI